MRTERIQIWVPLLNLAPHLILECSKWGLSLSLLLFISSSVAPALSGLFDLITGNRYIKKLYSQRQLIMFEETFNYRSTNRIYMLAIKVNTILSRAITRCVCVGLHLMSVTCVHSYYVLSHDREWKIGHQESLKGSHLRILLAHFSMINCGKLDDEVSANFSSRPSLRAKIRGPC